MEKEVIELDDDFIFEDGNDGDSKFNSLNVKTEENELDEFDFSFEEETTDIEEEEETDKLKGRKDEHVRRIEKALGLDFSEEQLAIIQHHGTPLNVLAGAGSGKTTVLVAKMLYKELAYKVKPLNMLAITFTSKATKEMQERYIEGRRKAKLKKVSLPTFRTFHALFLMLLQSMKTYNNVKVMGAGDESRMKFVLSRHVTNHSENDRMTILTDMFRYRGAIINKGISPDGIVNAEAAYADDCLFSMDNYLNIMQRYQNMKDTEGAIDFEDMQTIIYREIVEGTNTEPIEAFRRVWGEGDVYIDEYQDISKVQRMIMDKLIKDFDRFTTIGDDDQSIYSFRGSDPQYIIDFVYTYSKAERLKLTTNYRCKEEILRPVLPVIETNKKRVDKDIKAFNEGGYLEQLPIGDDVTPLINQILDEIDGYEGEMFEDIAILVRQNSQRMLLTDALIEKGVPVNISNEKHSLQNNRIYNTVLDVIEMIKEKDNGLFVEYCRYLFPHIRKDIIDKYNHTEESWYFDIIEQMFYNVKKEMITVIKKIEKTNNMYNAVVLVWKLLRGHYKRSASRGYGSYERTEEIVKYMLQISRGYSTLDFLDEEDRKRARIQLWCGSDEALKIDTLHSVKGLEYDIVYLVGLENDMIPNMRRYESIVNKSGIKAADEYLEEERRLFYVGCTRAKERLILSYNNKRPSPFISEIGS